MIEQMAAEKKCILAKTIYVSVDLDVLFQFAITIFKDFTKSILNSTKAIGCYTEFLLHVLLETIRAFFNH